MKGIAAFISGVIAISLAAKGLADVDLVTIPTREGVQLTIYNSEDITMVREHRLLTVKPGINRIQFTWANTLIDPTSIDFRILDHVDQVDLIDTTFPAARNDALQWNISSKLAGKVPVEIRYFTSGITWKADYVGIANEDESKLNLTGYVRVVNSSGELYDNAQTRLVVGTINLVEKIADLATRPAPRSGYSGLDELGRTKARDNFAKGILKAEAAKDAYRMLADMPAELDRASAPKTVVKEGLSEYFLFTIEGREDIKDKEPKRLISMNVAEVPLECIYKLTDREDGNHFTKYYRFKNETLKDDKGQDKELLAMENLGLSPLPDGMLRLYSEYANKDLAYVGGTSTKYVPIGERVEVNVGRDPDITIIRRVKDQQITNVVSRQYKRRVDDQFVMYYDLIDYDEAFFYEEEIVSGKPVDVKVELERRFDANVVLWAEDAPPSDWGSNEPGAYVDLHDITGRKERVDQNHVKYFLDVKPGEKQRVTYSVLYKRRKIGPELNQMRSASRFDNMNHIPMTNYWGEHTMKDNAVKHLRSRIRQNLEADGGSLNSGEFSYGREAGGGSLNSGEFSYGREADGGSLNSGEFSYGREADGGSLNSGEFSYGREADGSSLNSGEFSCGRIARFFLIHNASQRYRKCVTTCFLGLMLLASPTGVLADVDLVTIPTREGVQLTIYNSDDITMVREHRLLTVKDGFNRIQFSWANTLIDPTSIDFRILDHVDKVDLIDTTFPTGRTDALQWNIRSEMAGKVPVEIRYFTSGITWKADYVGIANQDETRLDVTGYVRVFNNSGELYDNAQTRLVVGTINLVEKISDLATRPAPTADAYAERPVEVRESMRRLFSGAVEKAAAPSGAAAPDNAKKAKEVIKAGLSEYFLFTIDGREDIKDKEPKRLVSMKVAEVPLECIYKLTDREDGDHFTKYYRFKNETLKDDNGNDKELLAMENLGLSPLPDGMLRLYSEYANKDLAYVGGTSTKYVPIGDRVEVNVGRDPDITVIRRVKDQQITNVVSRQYKRRIDDQFVMYYDLIDYDETLFYEVAIVSGKPIAAKAEIERHFDANVVLWGSDDQPNDWNSNEQGAYVDLHEIDGRVERVDQNHVKYFLDLTPGQKRFVEYSVTYKRRKIGPELNHEKKREPR